MFMSVCWFGGYWECVFVDLLIIECVCMSVCWFGGYWECVFVDVLSIESVYMCVCGLVEY